MTAPGPRKAPRRTAERILEASLALFNRFGEPNVSTTLISAELGISPGNLHYHYPAKEALTNRLFGRYEEALTELLAAAPDVQDVEDAWLFFHMLFELIWQYRFLYRDLNDLLSRNRLLETQFQSVLQHKQQAVRAVIDGLNGGPVDPTSSGPPRKSLTKPQARANPESDTVATAMVVVLTYWLNFEYARDPRRALETESASAALMRGAHHVLSLLTPYLAADQREHLGALAARYAGP